MGIFDDKKASDELNELFTNEFFDHLYDDFFGSLQRRNNQTSKEVLNLKEQINSLERELPKITVKNNNNTKDVKKLDSSIEKSIEETNNNSEKSNSSKETSEEQDDNVITKEDILKQKNHLLEEVDAMLLDDASKETLKKMVIYAYNYNLGITKKYIPFNMRIYSKDPETFKEITSFLIKTFYKFNYIKNDKKGNISFYEVEEIGQIEEIYSRGLGTMTLTDINVLNTFNKDDKNKLLKNLEKNIIKTSQSSENATLTIIYGRDKNEVDSMLDPNDTLKNKIFDFELKAVDEDSQAIYNSLIETLEKDNSLEDSFRIKLLEYINETYPTTKFPASDYKSSLIERILFNKVGYTINEETIPTFEKSKSNDEIFKDLNDLIGLDNVKQMLKDLVSLIEFKSKAGDNIKIKDTNMHMVFLGNPGTGKTTVARMIANILFNLKYIDENKLIEVSAKDLIGQYVGQTAPKTMEVIEKALGGVLFIDEAYSLASKPGTGNTFNDECIATLIQAMENYRDNLIVIFAGYTKEMDAFLKSNSGIISRIGYTLEFKDYTIDQLIEIEKSMFTKAGFILKTDAIAKSKVIIEKFKNTEGFGNARFIRNLYEKAVIKHATNTKNKKSLTSLKTITAEDITDENISKLD